MATSVAISRMLSLFGADQDDAEVRADGEGLREERDDLVGGGGGGDVVVLGREAEEQVADAAAGEEGLVAGLRAGCGRWRGRRGRSGRSLTACALVRTLWAKYS